MNEETLFFEALAKSPDERTRFLEQHCENQPELKARVLELVAASEKPDHILDRTLTDPAILALGNAPGEPGAKKLPPGAVVRYFGDYAIRKELGRGGMGVVYIATQVSLNRPVALKMIKAGILAGAGELRRFQQEAEAVASLDHPGIVPVYEVGEHDGQRYFTMKLINGVDLSSRLDRFLHDPPGAARLVSQIADAVHYAHQRGILHRDLKPANILLDQAGHPHVSDFGLATRVEADGQMTASGEILGSPAFMSPEQAAGRRGSITTATDVYGLGTILYGLLTGQVPFGGDNLIETLDAVRTRLPDRPRKINRRVPRDLELICLKCLEKHPADRYSSTADLADDLRHFTAGEPVSVRAAGVVERAAKWARRKPTLAAAYSLAFLAALLGTLGSVAIWQWRIAVQERVAAESQRTIAVRAANAERLAKDREANQRAAAVQARTEAERARTEAERLREKIEHVEYGRTIEVAHQEWRENHVAATLQLLDKTKPELRGWEWYYVSQLCHSELLTLTGHRHELRSAAYSPDGSRIVTAGRDNTAKVWLAKTGECVLTLRHNDCVESAEFSQDGTRIVTASEDKTARVWDAATGAELLLLAGHEPVMTASFSPDGSRVVTGGGDGTAPYGTISVWDARTGAEVLALEKHANMVTRSARFSPDAQSIVAVSFDSTIRLWDAKTGARLPVLPRSIGVSAASFSPDGSRIVIAFNDGTAKILDASTGDERLTFRGHSGEIYSVSFSPDGRRLATAGSDTTTRVWDAATGACLLTLRGHTGWVAAAAFSPDSSRIVTASIDGTAKVWDAATDPEFMPLNNERIHYSTSFSPDGSRVVAASHGIVVFDLATRAVALSRSFSFGTICASFSPDGSRIVVGGGGGQAHVLDATTGADVLDLQRHTGDIYSASYSSAGDRIITASRDGTANVWDATTGAPLTKLTIPDHVCRCDLLFPSASFSTDGSRVVTAGFCTQASVWHAVTGVRILTLTGHKGPVISASFSPDGSRVVTASWDKTAKVWDASTGETILTLEGHTAPVWSASFSPDCLRIVTASDDGKTKVWNAVSGAEVLTLVGSSYAVKSASFSQDGSRIVTAGIDRTVRVWDVGPAYRKLLAR